MYTKIVYSKHHRVMEERNIAIPNKTSSMIDKPEQKILTQCMQYGTAHSDVFHLCNKSTHKNSSSIVFDPFRCPSITHQQVSVIHYVLKYD